jgi:hypothetical protein
MSKAKSAKRPAKAMEPDGYLVMCGFAVVGRFDLPGVSETRCTPPSERHNPKKPAKTKKKPKVGEKAARVNAAAAAAGYGPKERVRRVFVGPKWSGCFVAWGEVRDDDEVDILVWRFENEAERVEAFRFFNACDWRRWRTQKELRAILATGDDWLIRYYQLGEFQFLNSAVHKYLLSTDPKTVILTEEPSEAAHFSRAKALKTIAVMTADFELDELDHDLYFEPVSPADPFHDFRADQDFTA